MLMCISRFPIGLKISVKWFLTICVLQILSLEVEASLQDITRSYRELAKTWHPDHNPSKDAEAMFMKIHTAYEVLLQRHKTQHGR